MRWKLVDLLSSLPRGTYVRIWGQGVIVLNTFTFLSAVGLLLSLWRWSRGNTTCPYHHTHALQVDDVSKANVTMQTRQNPYVWVAKSAT